MILALFLFSPSIGHASRAGHAIDEIIGSNFTSLNEFDQIWSIRRRENRRPRKQSLIRRKQTPLQANLIQKRKLERVPRQSYSLVCSGCSPLAAIRLYLHSGGRIFSDRFIGHLQS